jgi:hydroxyethylthiazole kinase-like uncharacterized protein yjeF
MIKGFAVDDVRAVEDAAMAALPEGRLMELAARGLAEIAALRLKELDGRNVVALVGGGNNGGDALYAVSRLAKKGFHAGAVVASSGVHEGGLRAASRRGVAVVPGDQGTRWVDMVGDADLVIDGITGIGGRPGLRGEARAWVAAIPERAYILAVDLPSGTDPAGLRGSTESVFADETVTFGVPKAVHLLPATEAAVGRLTVVDIGLDFSGRVPVVERLTLEDVHRLWPVPGTSADKYSRGVLGSITGTTRYPGAGVLSVLGAIGAGAGMVRYAGPASVIALVHQMAPEAVCVEGQAQAYVLGSGMDPEDPDASDQVTRIRSALASGAPVVVDAGALGLVGRRATSTVLTPHAGELARLLGRLGVTPAGVDEVTRDTVNAQPIPHAQAAADALNAVVLLKGSTTLVVSPAEHGRPVRSQNDAPGWLATAGAGDVLGGVVGALLAAGLDPVDAASLGALIHGVAAHQANPDGPVRALGVAQAIPRTVAALIRQP